MPKEHKASNPMDEENFPDSPTRRAADKRMAEPTNTPGSNPDAIRKGKPPVEEEE